MTRDRKAEIKKRFEDIQVQHNKLRDEWLAEAKKDWSSSPISASRLAVELWDVIREHDWVLAGRNLDGWVRRLWEFTSPHQYIGGSIGTATNIGIALGVGLAYKKTDNLVIDIQPDGDLMYDCGALWIGAHHNIPMLVIMYNNRAYGNSLRHQTLMARERRRSVENSIIGTEIDNPPPDFAQLARSMGCHGFGPIEDPKELKPVLNKAIDLLKLHRVPVLIDTICKGRGR